MYIWDPQILKEERVNLVIMTLWKKRYYSFWGLLKFTCESAIKYISDFKDKCNFRLDVGKGDLGYMYI